MLNPTGRVVGHQTVRGEVLLVIELHDETGAPTHNRETGTPYYRVIRTSPRYSVYYSVLNPEYRQGTWRFKVNRFDILTNVVAVTRG